VGSADGLVGGEAFSSCHHVSTDGGIHLTANTAPVSAGRPKVHRQVLTPVLATKARTEDGMFHPGWAATVCLPGMVGGCLLRRAGGWFPPPEARRRGGQPTRAGGRAPSRLALHPSKDDEDP
jgi:hypothetical protein